MSCERENEIFGTGKVRKKVQSLIVISEDSEGQASMDPYPS